MIYRRLLNASQFSNNDTNYQDLEDIENDPDPRFYPAVDVPLLCLSVFIVGTNLMVILLVWKKECLHNYTNGFLASLACSDFLTGLVGVPLFIGCAATHQNNVCISSVIFQRFLSLSTVLHLLLIALDRYYTIILPMKYPNAFPKRRAVACIVVIWTLSPIVSLTQLTWVNFDTVNVNENAEDHIIEIEKYYFSVCFALFFAFPMLLMTVMYLQILRVSFKHMRMIRKLNRRAKRRPSVMRAMHEYRGSILFATMLIIFCGCWMPYFLLGLQHHYGLFALPRWSEHIMVFLRFGASFFNPVLCAFCKPDFRFMVRSCLTKRPPNDKSDFIVAFTRRKSSSNCLNATMSTCAQSPQLCSRVIGRLAEQFNFSELRILATT